MIASREIYAYCVLGHRNDNNHNVVALGRVHDDVALDGLRHGGACGYVCVCKWTRVEGDGERIYK